MPHQKYRADLCSLDVRNPAAFPRRVEGAKELGRDLRYEPLERGIPTVFARVERAVALHHPSHVSGARLAQRRRSWCGTDIAEKALDVGHCPDQALSAAVWQ